MLKGIFKTKGHAHKYRGVTSFNYGHIHRYSGVSSVAFGGVDAHRHVLKGTTTFNEGHVHNYDITTGPGIWVFPGFHTHYYRGNTTANGRGPHTHLMRGVLVPARNDTV